MADSIEVEAPKEPGASIVDSSTSAKTQTGAKRKASPAKKAPARADAQPEHNSHLIRSREISPGPAIREIAAAYRKTGRDQFTLPLFDGHSATVTIARAQAHKLGGSVVSGHVADAPSSQVILAEKDGAVSGSIRWPDQNLVYEVRPLPEGGIRIGEVDPDTLGSCGVTSLQLVSNQARPKQPQKDAP